MNELDIITTLYIKQLWHLRGDTEQIYEDVKDTYTFAFASLSFALRRLVVVILDQMVLIGQDIKKIFKK